MFGQSIATTAMIAYICHASRPVQMLTVIITEIDAKGDDGVYWVVPHLVIYQHAKTKNILITWSTNLREDSAEESENGKDDVVRSESISHTDDDQRPLTEQKDRFTTKLVRKNGADYGANHEAKDKDRLSEVLEIRAITDQIPLYNENTVLCLSRVSRPTAALSITAIPSVCPSVTKKPMIKNSVLFGSLRSLVFTVTI